MLSKIQNGDFFVGKLLAAAIFDRLSKLRILITRSHDAVSEITKIYFYTPPVL